MEALESINGKLKVTEDLESVFQAIKWHYKQHKQIVIRHINREASQGAD
uniref:Uncharacterized protein n=1 Tax=Manihot esculenta TaxID=3983 RepID=A0A2C9V7C2_MANES